METKRLILRPFQVEDASALYALASDHEIGPNAGWPVHQSIAESKKVIETSLSKINQYAIVLKATNKLIGAIGLNTDMKRENPKILSLGYWIGREFWGNAYAVEASKQILKYAFEELKLMGVSIVHYEGNEKSKRVIAKLGFVYEGTLRYASSRYDGVVVDEVEYLMDKEVYNKVKEYLWRVK